MGILDTYKEVKKLNKIKKNRELERPIFSCDEKTCIQAIGNKYPDLMSVEGNYPMIARDNEYIDRVLFHYLLVLI